ncbi:MAG: hypothetical protein A3E80_04050 [Chlamydiae bacterium RIFCSPHIGHO2_12_FULL_49_9]|nr:MAG: hypothetical protein A3E80_04050 [Chlamydiae bacterium RIFCSPHIGHO2_12_FULL_49_9]
MHLIFFGFKGCGKTGLGKKIARISNRPFIDLDDLFAEPPRSLYPKLGEEKFRKLESELLFSLKPKTPSVIALGGGTVLKSQNISFLQSIGLLIYLERSFEEIKKNLEALPSFAKNWEHLRQIYLQRKPIYESIKALKLDRYGL